jgi:lysophospholipase L1-like esterase
MATVLIYGDSNSHGTRPLTVLGQFVRHAPGDRWPDALADALPGHTIIAEGLPGRTTVHDDMVEGGARNGLAVLPAILGSHAPLDLVVLMLGTNDLKQRFSVSAWEIARSVERLGRVVRAEAPGAALMLVAPAPVAPAGVLAPVFAGAAARQAGLEDALGDAAARLGAAYVEAGAHVVVSPVDGVHWEADAHRAFGAAMAGPVAAALAAA